MATAALGGLERAQIEADDGGFWRILAHGAVGRLNSFRSGDGLPYDLGWTAIY
jgi:hypothetical protein